jgi:hypothetical protein
MPDGDPYPFEQTGPGALPGSVGGEILPTLTTPSALTPDELWTALAGGVQRPPTAVPAPAVPRAGGPHGDSSREIDDRLEPQLPRPAPSPYGQLGDVKVLVGPGLPGDAAPWGEVAIDGMVVGPPPRVAQDVVANGDLPSFNLPPNFASPWRRPWSELLRKVRRIRGARPPVPKSEPRPYDVVGWPGNWWYWDPRSGSWVWYRGALAEDEDPPGHDLVSNYALWNELRALQSEFLSSTLSGKAFQRFLALWQSALELFGELAEFDRAALFAPALPVWHTERRARLVKLIQEVLDAMGQLLDQAKRGPR